MLVLLAERADTRNYTGERLPLSLAVVAARAGLTTEQAQLHR